MYKYTDGGLRNIRLMNGFTIKNTPYGEAVSIDDVEGLIQAICIALTKKKTKLTGAEFRYLRTAMLLSQPALAQMLGKKDGQAIAIWEKKGNIPQLADVVIRLLYMQHTNGNEKVKNLITSINEAERAIYFCMRKTAKGWSSVEEDKVVLKH